MANKRSSDAAKASPPRRNPKQVNTDTGPTPPEQTRREPLSARGERKTVSGAGVVRSGSSARSADGHPGEKKRPPRTAPNAMRYSSTDIGPGAAAARGHRKQNSQELEAPSPGSDAPLSKIKPGIGEPIPRGTNMKETSDPNFTAARRSRRQ